MLRDFPKRCEPAIKELEAEGFEYAGYTSQHGGGAFNVDDDPDLKWIDIPDRFRLSGSRGEYTGFTGDSFVYRLVSDGAGGAYVFKQLKSNHYKTTRREGTCPNCQKYIKRKEDDTYLTCHRCGWEYNPTQMLKNAFSRLF